MESKEFGSLDDIWCSLSEEDKKAIILKSFHRIIDLEEENKALRDAYKRKGERK